MIRRLLNIILVLSLIISITACQNTNTINSNGSKVVKPGETELPELTILVTPNMRNWMKKDCFDNYERQFEKQYGVTVNYEVYGGDYESNVGELMTKLITKDGPELIIDDWNNAHSLIEQGAVANARDKVPNISKMYESLVDSEAYYIPLGIGYQPVVLRKDMLEALQLSTPNLNWTAEDYYIMRDKWLEQSNRMFTTFELNETNSRYLRELELFDYRNKKANINTKELKNALERIRGEIFSGKYILNKNYTYKNYYNMLFEYTSQEYEEDMELRLSTGYNKQSLRSRSDESLINLLYAKDFDSRLGKIVVLPDSIYKDNLLGSLGIMINRNGANLELAYEYVNGLLSNEIQLEMYEGEESGIYPVNKAIESKIADIEKKEGYSEETLQLKEFIIRRIEKGEFQLGALRDMKDHDLYWMLIRDLVKYIFTDKPYSDAELSVELQKLEDKYNIILSE
ncbi:MAG TPA: extracellular solute-binding protein [Patescibacteria group bacterium]|nr:extracellular solute-binding protein [Patescibacteria group bacterium]